MHTARSRNDEVAACIRYRLREDVLEAIETTLALRESLVEVATEHTETIMPGYTHLQPAQPTTVAHWALAYEGAVRRDTERLLEAYGRINQSPLGGAAFAGTTFGIDRERTAELLGFEGSSTIRWTPPRAETSCSRRCRRCRRTRRRYRGWRRT